MRRTPEEAEAIIAEFGQRARELSDQDQRGKELAAKVEMFINYAYRFGAMIVLVTAWVCKVQWDVLQLYKDTGKHAAKIEVLEAQKNANDLAFLSLNTTITTLRSARDKELEGVHLEIIDLKTLKPKVDEMWFMKVHGKSNRETFIEEHGKDPQ